MRRNTPAKPLTPPVEDQLREALTEAGTESAFLLTVRWGWISGPARDTNNGELYPMAVHLHRPTNLLSDAVRAQQNHRSLARHAAAIMIAAPLMVALLWILYLPLWPLGLIAGAGVAWAMWTWLLPLAAVSPLDRAILIPTVAADSSAASIVTAVLSVPFVQELDDLGTQLPHDDTGHTQYLEAWKSHWAALEGAHRDH